MTQRCMSEICELFKGRHSFQQTGADLKRNFQHAQSMKTDSKKGHVTRSMTITPYNPLTAI